MTYEQEPKEFESSTLGFIWFDEPPTEPIFKASVARLRRGGLMFITETPLMGSAWIYDQIYTQVKKGIREVIEAGVEDNCKIHGVRGILEHDDIVKMLENYDPDETLARAFGKFQHLTGLVFKMFNQKIHILEPFQLDPREWCVYERFDSHPRTEDAVGWYAVDRQGNKIIIDELWTNPTDDEELAIKIKSKASQYRVVDRAIEPAAFNEDQHDNKHQSLAKKLNKYGLKYRPASKERMAAIRRTKNALAFREVGGRLIKPPELFVFSNCVRHIHEFLHWQWSEWSGKTADRRGLSEKPQDKDDHMMENLGRFLIDEPKFIEYVVQNENESNVVQGKAPDLF
jgi:phage terminase large subunit-like protein